jgi:hypothetical protein
MNADRIKDQDNSTLLINSFFKPVFIRVNPRLCQFLARALHKEGPGMLHYNFIRRN